MELSRITYRHATQASHPLLDTAVGGSPISGQSPDRRTDTLVVLNKSAASATFTSPLSVSSLSPFVSEFGRQRDPAIPSNIHRLPMNARITRESAFFLAPLLGGTLGGPALSWSGQLSAQGRLLPSPISQVS